MTISAPGSSVSRHAWIVVALLVPVALLNYLDRQMLASMKFSVMRDIPDIALEANWGAILATFKWVYAGLSPIGGYLADRYSRHYVIAGSLLVWSMVTWATGHVDSYQELLATRALMGISEAFYIPAALALIADVHRGSTRSRATGFHQMGIYCGVIVGGFGGYAADHPGLGWRWAFDVCGLIGIAYALPLFLLLRRAVPAAQSRESTTGSTTVAAELGRAGPGRARAPRQRVVPAARRLFHAAGPRRLDRPRLDAGDPQGGVRHRPGPRRRVRHALLAARGHRRRDRRRLARRSLDATQSARPHQHERARAWRSSCRRCSAWAMRPRPACCGWRSCS